jgi:uncharacterized membrane protein YdjX (TVP38/TMEM64 family)
VTTPTSLELQQKRQQQVQLQKRQRQTKVLLITAAVVTTTVVAYSQRALLMTLMNRQVIQHKALTLLQGLQRPDGSVSAKSLCVYAATMAVWEFLGLTTIPVETAAAMVFGWTAFPVSFGGKLLGALVAFFVGRHFLADTVRSKLLPNSDGSDGSSKASPWQVLWAPDVSTADSSTSASSRSTTAAATGAATGTDLPFVPSPLQTALLMKFSCFPEAVKNFGSSLLPTIQWWMFVVATAVHGGSYTALWTWLGVDTAARLQTGAHTSLPAANLPLHITLVLAGVIGVVVSPLLMAWWLRTLKRQADAVMATAE